ncbi:tetratricopeptide repeat protein [Roseibium sp. HPY-6]|uniref:tetratricopeptide repeat protein n=1 Tax=Roseibium sp. HPY-6 TaxID=3229852 RepID=UPI00338EE704
MNLTTPEKCDAAERLIEKGRFEDAEFLLDQVLESHPSEMRALVSKAGLHMKAGRLPDAKRCLQGAYDKNPGVPLVLSNMASLALLESRVPDAITHLLEANALQPDFFPAVLLLAQIHQQAGDMRQASKWLAEASRLKPGNTDVLVASAAFELSRERISEATALYDKALAIDPDHVPALSGLAQLRALAGDYEAAGELAKRAHLLAPTDPDTAVILARTYQKAGALADAQKLIERFRNRYADYAPVVLQAAEILIARGQVAEALSVCAAWLRKSPADAVRIVGFLKVLKKAGAWKQIDQMCGTLPEDVSARDLVRSLREEALHALGRSEEAWASWAARRELAPGRPETPLHVTLPGRTPLLDELVLMRFANAWANVGPIKRSGPSLIDGLWKKLTASSGIDVVSEDPQLGLNGRGELLADLAARTCLNAHDMACFKPYLAAEPARENEWRQALPQDERPLVGVFWEGTAPGLQIDHLMKVFAGKPYVPVSLQFDEARHQLRMWPEAIDAGVALAGLEDIVNVVNCLDLVVGPDGIPLHIAGALGRKGVAVLPENHEWYWAGTGAESLWYPSVKRIVRPIDPTWKDAICALSSEIDMHLS